jgi:hypothetical protein
MFMLAPLLALLVFVSVLPPLNEFVLAVLVVVSFIVWIVVFSGVNSILSGGFLGFLSDVRNGGKNFFLLLQQPGRTSLFFVPLVTQLPVLIVVSVFFLAFFNVFVPAFYGNIWGVLASGFGLLLLLFLIVFLIIFSLSFVMYCIVVDGKGLIESIFDSVRLVWSNPLEVLVFYVVLFLVGGITFLIPMFFHLVPQVGLFISSTVSTIVGLLVTPWVTFNFIVFYSSLREKH